MEGRGGMREAGCGKGKGGGGTVFRWREGCLFVLWETADGR